jgi:hypothetical protein
VKECIFSQGRALNLEAPLLKCVLKPLDALIKRRVFTRRDGMQFQEKIEMLAEDSLRSKKASAGTSTKSNFVKSSICELGWN